MLSLTLIPPTILDFERVILVSHLTLAGIKFCRFEIEFELDPKLFRSIVPKSKIQIKVVAEITTHLYSNVAFLILTQ